MRILWFFLAAILSGTALADNVPIVALNQNIAAIDYSKEGKQTGCGIRVTGEAPGDLWINILLSVFAGEPDSVGMFKVVVRKVATQNGEPQLSHGKLAYSSIGNIREAWLKTDSNVALTPYAQGAASHGDGFMTSLPFSNAVDLLVAIPESGFKTGIVLDNQTSGMTFAFDQRISKDEAQKLTGCMKNLRDAAQNNGSAL
jgi:hypothetical protein